MAFKALTPNQRRKCKTAIAKFVAKRRFIKKEITFEQAARLGGKRVRMFFAVIDEGGDPRPMMDNEDMKAALTKILMNRRTNQHDLIVFLASRLLAHSSKTALIYELPVKSPAEKQLEEAA